MVGTMKPLTAIDIAKVCHEANRAYCEGLGDFSQKPWAEADEWQRESAIKGVQFRQDHPSSGAIEQHNDWMKHKIADGWVHGEVKDAKAKTHPCLRPYDTLPEEQRAKDRLFAAVCDALLPLVDG